MPEQLRAPPAYQTYPSDELANSKYYLMTLAERGLREAMMFVCWYEDSVASDPEEIAFALRRPVDEVKAALSSGRVLSYFAPSPNEATRLICPELVRQMNNAMTRRKAQSEGGQESAKRNKERAARMRGANHSAKQGAPEKSRAEASREEQGRGEGVSSKASVEEEETI
jgi:hypothetical protein